MRSPFRRISPLLLALLLVLTVLVSCGDDTGSAPTVPTEIALAGGQGQSGEVGASLSEPIAVRVLDQFGDPAAGAEVTWSTGDGTLAPPTSVTDGAGTASTVWTLGPEAGPQTATATVPGAGTVSFEATATPGPVSEAAVSPATATVQALGATQAFAAEARDAFGNEVTDATFTWTSSDEGVATVEGEGATATVTAVANGTATITATSEEGPQAEAELTVEAPEPFEPTENTQISGTLEVTSVNIPAGVTVTATGDLVLNVAGAVDIAGTLVGDCVAVEVRGAGAVTVTGRVANVCDAAAPAEGEAPPPLTLVADGDLTIEGDVVPAGDFTIKNDPLLEESEFEFPDATARALVLRSGGATPASASRTGAGGRCVVRGSVAAPVMGPGSRGRDGFSRDTGGQVGDGFRGGDGFIGCRGDMTIGQKLRAQSGGHGGNAGNPLDPGKTASTVQSRAGHGGNGGTMKLGSTGVLGFDGATVSGANGGNGGNAFHQAGEPGGSSRAVGGKGGDGGALMFVGQTRIQVEAGGLVIEFGSGGAGGDATARGADGRHGDGATCPQPGGDGFATAGDGGDSSIGLRRVGTVVGEANITFRGGEGAPGGDATARAGDGGDGSEECRDGEKGGTTTAQGGHGGDGRGTYNGTLQPSSEAGEGGDAVFEPGGNGGDGWYTCQVVFFSQSLRGGNGGDGGDALGGTGVGGTGFGGDAADGTPEFDDALIGNGGDAAPGIPAGTPGKGGRASIADPRSGASALASTDLELQLPDGMAAGDDACQATVTVDIEVAEDPAGHEPFIGLTAVEQLVVQLLPGGGINISGSAPWVDVSGTFEGDGSFTASGTGTVAGRSGIRADMDGHLVVIEDPDAPVRIEWGDGSATTVTLGGNGGLPEGQPATYRVRLAGSGEPEGKPATLPPLPDDLYPSGSPWIESAMGDLDALPEGARIRLDPELDVAQIDMTGAQRTVLALPDPDPGFQAKLDLADNRCVEHR